MAIWPFSPQNCTLWVCSKRCRFGFKTPMKSFFSIFFSNPNSSLSLSFVFPSPHFRRYSLPLSLSLSLSLCFSSHSSILTLSHSLLLCSLSHALHFSAYSLTLFASLLGMFTHSQLSFLFFFSFFFCWIILCMHIESQIILSLYFLFLKICSASLPHQIENILDLLCQIGKSVVCLSLSLVFLYGVGRLIPCSVISDANLTNFQPCLQRPKNGFTTAPDPDPDPEHCQKIKSK